MLSLPSRAKNYRMDQVDFFPAFLDLKNRKCLVVGAGPVGLRKARRLTQCGARVLLVSPDAPDTCQWASEIEKRSFSPHHLDGAWLVVAATADHKLNADIGKACDAQRIFCNVVSDTTACSYIVPSVVDRSPLVIAVSSGGTSPILSRVVKTKLESLIPTAYARLASLVGRHRHSIKARIPDDAERAEFWHGLLNGPVGELAFSQNHEDLDAALTNAVANSTQTGTGSPVFGHVALVGAGPGDPDLLTFRALRLIQSADVIVYDRLVSAEILNLTRNDAEMIYAGKARADHTLAQDSINNLLVDLAQKNQSVVRLKGGDPFIFGRGGEEIETLADAGVSFQVVPGITAASGCAAFSGIPLTHRDHAQSCVFVTGHLKDGEINLNWNDLRDPSQTIVVYMGLVGLEQICKKLIDIGRSPQTPAALIEQGTTPTQRIIKADLSTLADLVNSVDVKAPTLLIIGSVVELHEKLMWYQNLQRTTTITVD